MAVIREPEVVKRLALQFTSVEVTACQRIHRTHGSYTSKQTEPSEITRCLCPCLILYDTLTCFGLALYLMITVQLCGATLRYRNRKVRGLSPRLLSIKVKN